MKSDLERISNPKPFALLTTVLHLPLLCYTLFLLFTVTSVSTTAISYLIFYVIIYIYGTNIFFHRYWAHKQFTANPLVVKFFTLAGILSMVSGPIGYVAVHRTHHAYSDTEKDPHSPINGRIYALIGWMFKVHQIRIPITLIRDVIKVRWLVKIDLYRIYIIYAIVLVSSVISLSMTLGLLMAMFTAFFIEMGINAFMHDPVKQESLNANEFLCWITAGGLKHKLHHENSGKATEADPGYYFIKLISINE